MIRYKRAGNDALLVLILIVIVGGSILFATGIINVDTKKITGKAIDDINNDKKIDVANSINKKYAEEEKLKEDLGKEMVDITYDLFQCILDCPSEQFDDDIISKVCVESCESYSGEEGLKILNKYKLSEEKYNNLLEDFPNEKEVIYKSLLICMDQCDERNGWRRSCMVGCLE